jgi:hypothetical protein
VAEGKKPRPANYRDCRHAKEGLQNKKYKRKHKSRTGRVFSSNLSTPGVSFVAGPRGSKEQKQQLKARQVPGTNAPAGINLSTPASGQQKKKKSGSVRGAPTVNSQPLDNMLGVVTTVQLIMTVFNDAVSEEEIIVAIIKIELNLMTQNGHYSSRPLKFFTFNANGIGRWRYELSKQLQELHVDVALFSETSETSREVLHSKFPFSSNRPLPGQKRRNCRCI